MDLRLTGKRVLVTGASRGIGLAVVRAFREEGAAVVATARRSTPELEATGAAFVPADLAAPDGPRELVERVLAGSPHLDVLVNNAGGGEPTEAMLTDPFGGDDDAWDGVFALNLHSAVRVTRAALPALTAARGAVVTVGSDSARRVGASDVLSYAVAKAALSAFSRGLAERVGPVGVRVNVVSPSATRTPLIEGVDGIAAAVARVTGADRTAVVEGMAQQGGMLTGALIEPDEIARAVLLLASPTMPGATGENWGVDAGSVKSL